jgi:Ca2+-binding EF-hand superfamily protein
MDPIEKKELALAFKKQILIEQQLERAKIDLASKPDFNLMDSFRMFDIDGKGWISLVELKNGLADLGIYCTNDEAALFFKRYDRDVDGRLRYSDFCEAFSPRDGHYSSVLEQRTPFYVNAPRYQRDEFFTKDTRIQIRETLRCHLACESASELLRQRLYQRPYFSIYEAFKTCDFHENGFVSADELRLLLETHGLFVSRDEVVALMQKYDKNNDGLISYNEVSVPPFLL